ncbi:MAG: ribonuclease activity regulator RraA [bacterium]
MTQTPGIARPEPALVARLKAVGAATCSSTLAHMGLRNCHITGPVSWNAGKVAAGPALTLQFMPKREDMYGDGEYADPEKQLHRHVLYHVQPGDFVVVDARADMTAGIFGEMMLTYFKGRGGAGLVIDGCIRDYPNARDLDLAMWLRGVTPNFHTQTGLMPFAVNTPIACGGVTVMPGDIIVADDDGAVCVPVALADQVITNASAHHDWEDFSRMKLAEGALLQRYYPLHADAQAEYLEWRAKNPVRR